MTPTVKAIMTPSIITLDAFWVSRITAAVIEIIAIAAIKHAGAITQGMSCANIARDCIGTPPWSWFKNFSIEVILYLAHIFNVNNKISIIRLYNYGYS